MWSEACFTEWEQEILLYLDNELPPEGRIRVERHVQRCTYCRRYIEEQRKIDAELGFDLRYLLRIHPLPPDFTQNVIDHLPGMLPLTRLQRLGIVWERFWQPAAWWQLTQQHVTVAVALLLLIVIGGGSTLLNHLPNSGYDVRVIEVGKRAFQVAIGDPIANHQMKDLMFRLPDGSHIVCKPDSSIQFDAYQMRGDDRALSLLRGEIWCDVVPTGEGFSVRTPEAMVRVMGTRFSVKVVAGETRVEVVDGLVLLEKLEDGMPKTAAVRAKHESSVPRRGRIQVPARLDEIRIQEIQTAFARIDAVRKELEAPIPATETDMKHRDTGNEIPGNKPKDIPLFIVPGR